MFAVDLICAENLSSCTLKVANSPLESGVRRANEEKNQFEDENASATCSLEGETPLRNSFQLPPFLTNKNGYTKGGKY